MNRVGVMVLSCEHAGNDVPKAYQHLFATDESVLTTHRGYDIGIASVARQAAKLLDTPLLACRMSRLLIDPNRSRHHRNLFSEFSRSLPPSDKQYLIEHIWEPHRQTVIESVTNSLQRHQRVLHLAWHSFTPVLNGHVRKADIGLLYDPRREPEKLFALAVQQTLQATTDLRIRRNYPYRGRDDGLTTALRRMFDADRYLGLEIELNQNLLVSTQIERRKLISTLCQAVRQAWSTYT